MAHTLIVRGFDDLVHEKLGEMANHRGISINSIVKDAVDIWLKEQQLKAPKKHNLVIYSDEESVIRTIKTMDRLAEVGNLFKCFIGSPGSASTQLLSKLKWYDGAIKPYPYPSSLKAKEKQQMQQTVQAQVIDQGRKDIKKYYSMVIENILKKANNRKLCCMDFVINDIGKTSIKQALAMEKFYNSNRLAGLMYCIYKTDTLLNSEIKDLIELFGEHDQIFILKEDEVYKLHLTKENVHKFFLN
jgi:hypothetical protein